MTKEAHDNPASAARKSRLIWGGMILFAMAWMFVVGILVGRGMAPVPGDHAALQEELETLKEEEWAEGQARLKAQIDKVETKDPHLPFYDELVKPPSKTVYSTRPARRPTVQSPPAPDNRQTAAEPAPASDGPGRFTVQVGAFKDAESADRMVKTLRDKGYPAYQVGSAANGKATMFRVRVGFFANRPAAEKMLKKMGKQGKGAIIVATK